MEQMKFGKVAVLSGGLSNEKEASVHMGEAILNSLHQLEINAQKYDYSRDFLTKILNDGVDRVFLSTMGKYGRLCSD